MSTTITFNGSSYTIPAIADASWGANVSSYLVAISTGCLQKTGGTFTLTAEVNFGATYGIKAARLKSQTTNIAAAGFLWLAKTDTINWRNNANDGDLPLGIDSSNRLTFNSLPITSLALGAANTVLRVNSGGTATEYAKLVAANIDPAAAIADTQLATIATAGKVSNSATTAASANTASAIVARDGSGNFSAGTITAALTGSISGNAATVTTNANLTGPVTSVGNATAIADGAIAVAKLATTTAGFFPVGAVTTGIPTYVAMSGDATLASTGAITLGTVPVGKGGTGVTGSSTGSVGVVLSTSPTITTPSIVTAETYLAGAESRYNNAANTFYVGFKGGNAAANKIWTLPLVDGGAGQILKTDGSATLGWVSAFSNPMATTGDMVYGGASGASTNLATGSTAGVLHGGNAAVPTWSKIVNADIDAAAAIAGSKIVTATTSVSGVLTLKSPTITVLSTPGAGTYTTPAGVLWLHISMVGGGGGASGSGGAGGASGNAVTASTATTFGSGGAQSSAGAGGGGTFSNAGAGGAGGTGGTSSLGSGAVGLALTGANGQNQTGDIISTTLAVGGMGAASPFGGGGAGTGAAQAGGNAPASTGAGGGGGGGANASGSYSGSGGGAGGYVSAIIASPAGSYSYVCGTAGVGGGAGATGAAGGNGGGGIIIIIEHYY